MITSFYFWKIHRYVGTRLSRIFIGFHILAYTYIGFLLHGLFLADSAAGQQPLEIYSLFFGLVFPVVNSFLHLGVKYDLYSGLQPNPQRDEIIRDAERDAKRDVERDITRDRERDMRRDLYKDREPTDTGS
jgi:hypothetical protein